MNLAQIESGIVANVIQVDPTAVPNWAADWPELPDGVGIGWAWDGAVWAPPRGPASEQLLADAKAKAWQKLSEAICGARLALITDLPGQEMIYLAKEAEARAWITAEAPVLADYPLLAAEVGITAPDADALAQIWLNLSSNWRTAAAQLEARRMTVSAEIEAAGTLADIAAALSALNG
ncbi:hypothetical protein C8J27_11061 [Rhodobacter aestuarii]|uniref:Uncharacterized protein n=1 Tax=Rhodobacter aestuarii TaxID=453582 RepID=A0A1N7Q0W3_9RHOB|nr:hypothetical protein [Rhodobacter aestuarii]PTV94010.1 hypothetical protein C8J27_11061 [Rhodobacter aestuarii]SIT16508.1 hypothetical protein SAMN05421580_11261 [Rhodobacter aestuarii]